MENILSKITKFSLILILLTPLLVSKSLLYPFITAKAFYFNILIELAVISFVLLIYFNKKYLVLFKKNWILIIFAGYLVIKAVSDLLGANFFKSFWGNYERMMGLFTWIHFFIFLILLIFLFKKKKDYILLFDISIGISLLICVYAIFQKMGVSFVLDSGISRLRATMGNSAFLASYLIFNIFFALYLAFKRENIKSRIYYSSAVILQTIILFFTATRGGMLGWLAGFGLFLMLGIWLGKSKKLKILSGSVIVIILVVGGIFYLNKDSSFVQNIEPLKRISSISFQDSTVKSRLLLWELSLKTFHHNPVLGWGENNINLVVDKYYDERIKEDWFDSTHNIFCDNLLGHGVLGLVFYLAFIFSLLFYLFKNRIKNRTEFIVFVPLIVAYVVQNFFLFDTHSSLIMFFLLVGFIIIINFEQNNYEDSNQKGYLFFIPFILIILSISFIFLNIKAIKSAYYTSEARRYSVADTKKSMDLYNKAIDNAFYGYENIANLGSDWLKDIDSEKIKFSGDVNDLIILNRKAMDKAIESDPLYSKNYLVMSKIYQLFMDYDDKYIDESVVLLERTLPLSPNRLVVYNALAQAYFYKEDFNKSANYLKQGMPYNLNKGRYYYNLGVMQLLAKNMKEGKESIDMARNENHKFSINEYLRLVNTYLDLEEYEEAINCYKKAIEIDSKKISFYSGIAAIYKKIGEKEKAKEYALKILEIDPDSKKQIDEFLKTLE